jgi:hypothetical protein
MYSEYSYYCWPTENLQLHHSINTGQSYLKIYNFILLLAIT